MAGKVQQDQPAPLEFPDLAAAYEAAATTGTRVNEMERRLKSAKSDLILRKRDREALGGRAARGENITGTDLRQADEAIRDAEATITLLTEALPGAMNAARDADQAVSPLERAAKSAAFEPFRAVREEARLALVAAQAAFDRADADTDRLPKEAAEAFDSMLQRHGRDRQVKVPILWARDMANQQNQHIEAWNRNCNPGNEKPLQTWMP